MKPIALVAFLPGQCKPSVCFVPLARSATKNSVFDLGIYVFENANSVIRFGDKCLTVALSDTACELTAHTGERLALEPNGFAVYDLEVHTFQPTRDLHERMYSFFQGVLRRVDAGWICPAEATAERLLYGLVGQTRNLFAVQDDVITLCHMMRQRTLGCPFSLRGGHLGGVHGPELAGQPRALRPPLSLPITLVCFAWFIAAETRCVIPEISVAACPPTPHASPQTTRPVPRSFDFEEPSPDYSFQRSPSEQSAVIVDHKKEPPVLPAAKHVLLQIPSRQMDGSPSLPTPSDVSVALDEPELELDAADFSLFAL